MELLSEVLSFMVECILSAILGAMLWFGFKLEISGIEFEGKPIKDLFKYKNK